MVKWLAGLTGLTLAAVILAVALFWHWIALAALWWFIIKRIRKEAS